MSRMAIPTSLLLLGLGLLPQLAQAREVDQAAFQRLIQPDNFVEIGVGYVSDASARFGRYNALYSDGFFAVLGLDYLQPARWDAEQPDYFALRLADAGLGNRRFDVRYGRAGVYELRAGYRERRARFGNDRVTIYRPAADGLRVPPPGWVPAATTAGLNLPAADLSLFNVNPRRRELSLGATGHFRERWTLTTDVRQEDRDGDALKAALFGNSGGNPRAAFLPVPIEYRTRYVDVGLNYQDRQRQLQLAYHASLFSNDQPSIRFVNPWSTIAGWAPGSGFPDGRGELAGPPDNQFHQLRASGGWNFSPSLRGVADLAVGRMTQDERFLPFTANPLLAETIVQDLPAASLDGRIDTTAFNLRLIGRQSARFHWTASYRLDDRNNRTPMREFVTIGGDSQAQDAGPSSSRRRYNLPYDYRDQRLRLDGSWRWTQRTRLSGALQQRRTERSYSARERSDEQRVELRLQHNASARVQVAAVALLADRDGSRYDGAVGFLAGHDPGYTDTLAGQWVNLPSLRLYHLADRRRHRLGAQLAVNPADHWTVHLEAATATDDFRNTELGLTESRVNQWTGSLNWSPSRDFTAHAFVSLERLASEQQGWSIRGGANRIPDSLDPDRRWQVDHRDRVETVGLGFQRQWLETRFSLRADYVHARADARQQVSAGPALAVAPLPEVSNRLDSLILSARYRLSEPWQLELRYWHERFRSSDWAFDGVAIEQLANVVLPGELSPNYRVQVVSASLRYRF